MSKKEIVEAEVVEKGISFGSQTASDPAQVMAMASQIAKPLAELIDSQQLYVNIQGKEHVTVEGWTTLGAMLGVVPREVSVKLLDDGNYEAVVELYHMETGQIRGRASSLCGTDRPWNKRDEYAKRSMAITRATGKAFRLSYSWVMKMAGYNPTPAEEMPADMVRGASKAKQAPKPSGYTFKNGPHSGDTIPGPDATSKSGNPTWKQWHKGLVKVHFDKKDKVWWHMNPWDMSADSQAHCLEMNAKLLADESKAQYHDEADAANKLILEAQNMPF